MSNAVFPSLASIAWSVFKSPTWSTRVQRSTGGSELRASYFSRPLWKWRLTYELLRQAAGFQELQSLVGFFNARQGSFDSFLYSDPSDNAVAAHGFGVGNGLATAFQLQRSIAGPRVPATWANRTLPVPTIPNTNLVPWSEDFTSWALNSAIANANVAIAPDGTRTADQVVPTGVAGSYIGITTAGAIIGQVYTLSVFAKADVSPLVFFEWSVPEWNSTQTTFHLDTGTVTAGIPGDRIEDWGNGWYRCIATRTRLYTAGNAAVYIYVDSYGVGGANRSVFLWGAQLNPGTTATPYVPTNGAAVTVNPSYWPNTADAFEPVTDLVPAPTIFRTDWRGTVQLYPFARTNLFPRSQDIANAAWLTIGTMTVVQNDVGPDGVMPACTITDSDAAVECSVRQILTIANDRSYLMFSAFVKKDANSTRFPAMFLTMDGGSTPVQTTAQINTATGAFIVVNNSSTDGGALVDDCGTYWRLTIWCRNNGSGNTSSTAYLVASDSTSFGARQAGATGSSVWTGAMLTPSAVKVFGSYIATTSTSVTVTDYTLSATGVVTLAGAALATGAYLTWTGSYYWRVRFEQDLADFEEFMYQLWKLQQITLVSVKAA